MLPFQRFASPVIILVSVASLAACEDPIVPPGGASAPQDPAAAQFVTSDIENFWRAYDAGASAAAFQTGYLDAGSAGLKGFARAKGLTAANLAATVQRYPRYYANIRPNTLRLSGDEALLDRIRENYRRIKALYP